MLSFYKYFSISCISCCNLLIDVLSYKCCNLFYTVLFDPSAQLNVEVHYFRISFFSSLRFVVFSVSVLHFCFISHIRYVFIECYAIKCSLPLIIIMVSRKHICDYCFIVIINNLIIILVDFVVFRFTHNLHTHTHSLTQNPSRYCTIMLLIG